MAAFKKMLGDLEIEKSEQAKLRRSVKDLVIKTPRTELAASRFKDILHKIKPAHKEIVKKMAMDIFCELAKKLLFGETGGA